MGCIVPEAESRLLADADLSLHTVRRRIFSSAECHSSLTEHRWTHSSLFHQVAPTLQDSSVFIELLHPDLVVGHSGWTHKSA